MNKNQKKEFFRDIIALGSIVFYLIVLARALIQPYLEFVYQLVISLIVLSLLSFLIKDSDNYLARMLILVIFTSLFYNDKIYTYFVSFIFLLAIYSSYYLENSKEKIIKGLVLGIISSLIGYYLTNLIFIFT